MNIKTKYKLGCLVYYIQNGTIYNGIIRAIKIKCTNLKSNDIEIMYLINNIHINEKTLYETKEDCARSWLNNNGIDIKI